MQLGCAGIAGAAPAPGHCTDRHTERTFTPITSLSLALLLGATSPGAMRDSTSRAWVRLTATDSVSVAVGGPATADAIVLVAGPMGGEWGYRRLVPALVEAGHRVVVIDPFDPAQAGDAGAPTLTALADRWAAALDSLGVSRGTVVAHSLASSLALRLTVRHPRLVRAIVSLEGGVTERMATRGLRSASAAAPIARVFGAGGMVRSRVASSLRERSAEPSWVTKDVVEAYARPLSRDMSRTLRLLRELGEAREPESIRARLGEVRVPFLLLLGEVRQPARPPEEEIATLRASLGDFAIEEVAGAGHFVHEERPEAVVAAVRRVAEATRSAAAATVPQQR